MEQRFCAGWPAEKPSRSHITPLGYFKPAGDWLRLFVNCMGLTKFYIWMLAGAGDRVVNGAAVRCGLILLAMFGAASGCAAAGLTLAPEKASGIYQPGEKIVWRAVAHDELAANQPASHVVKLGGAKIVGQGMASFQNGCATIETTFNSPGTLLAEITVTNSNGQAVRALAGAAIAPEKIPVSSPCPADFDAFWKSKLDELAAVSEHAVLKLGQSGKAGVNYWKLTLDNIRGTHIQGQLARLKSGKRFPAMLIVQWAGVYPLQKAWVTDRAAEGWLVLNISAHDLPIDEPESFYENLTKGALNNYTAIGNDDREKSYFLRMFLSCYRAVEYLAERPDWDGKTLVVTGTSQGGLQSFVAAGLNPKVTGIMSLVPAGCDNTGDLVGRKPGWPYWMANAGDHDLKQVRETSRYFDGVNFAARVKCPALIGLGLIDTTSPPSGVFAAINQLKGSKEVVVMPESNHHGDNNTQAEFVKREAAWRSALLKGQPVPPVEIKMAAASLQ
jgi:cephalosporin-C deacetylase